VHVLGSLLLVVLLPAFLCERSQRPRGCRAGRRGKYTSDTQYDIYICRSPKKTIDYRALGSRYVTSFDFFVVFLVQGEFKNRGEVLLKTKTKAIGDRGS
jgi:hypothetical protein